MRTNRLTWTILLSATLLSCLQVRRAARGDLPNGSHFEVLYFDYVKVPRSMYAKDCKVFSTQIRNSQNKWTEQLIWYSCDSMLPVKVFLTRYSDTSRELKGNFLVADTSDHFSVPLTENESTAIAATNTWYADHQYPKFPIRGFSAPSRRDSLRYLPFFRQVLRLKYYN
jgi:hypothetical protein